MSFLKIPLYFILCPVVLLFVSCKNKNSSSETGETNLESNPAYRTLNDSIRKFPSSATLYLRRASRLSQENAHELAYADFLKAWTIQPSLENALPFAANLEILGKHQERFDLLNSLNHRYPENTQVGRLLAEAAAASGDRNLALAIYNRMILADSLDPETQYEKALLLEQLKDTAGAINTLQKAYASQGVDTYGLELAHLYAEQKNPRALEICDYIIKKDSAGLLIDPFFIKGIYFSNIKRYARAIVQFDSCIARDWKTTDAYLEKGRAYFQMKNYNAAIQTFTMAITVTQTDPDAYFWLGRCYEAQQRKMDAIYNYRKAIALDKNFKEAWQRMENLDSGFAHPSH
jgi:tetratricopeptide (TPR) repeat protein